MTASHNFTAGIKWTGNTGSGTKTYHSYDRAHVVTIADKPEIGMSSDPVFRGDKTRYNPEVLLVASLASCHMLWYLHLCADAGIVVVEYTDTATGTMVLNDDGSGQFSEVMLKPVVRVSEPSMISPAMEIHNKANEMCFIARSCNFPVRHDPVCNC